MNTINERLRRIASKTGMDRLIRETEIGFNRWKTIMYNKDVRISTEEMEALCKIYPQYAYWLTTGEIIPTAGQVSPDYEELARQEPQKSGTHD
jgi:hypothetical protein